MDMDVWLGPAAAELTPEQRDRFDREVDAIHERIGDDPDDQDDRDAALSATVQYLLGDLTIDDAGHARTRTRDAARAALLAAQQTARMAVQDGMTESDAARRASIDRMVVRKVMGK